MGCQSDVPLPLNALGCISYSAILLNHNATDKTGKFTLLCCCHSDSSSFSNNVVSREGPRSESCNVAVCSQGSLVSFSLERLLSLPLAFKILTLLKITDQVFHQMSFGFSLSDVSSRIDSGYASLAGITEVMVCSHHVLSGSHYLCWSLV